MMPSATRVLALFDLDGTLIPWDTQLLFYNHVVKRFRWRLIFCIPFFCCLPLAWLLGDTRMKRLFLSYLWMIKKSEIRQLALDFVESTIIPLLYVDVLERLKDHQNKGDLCVLTTASPDIYASILAEKLGVDLFFATDVLLERRMPFYPKFPQGNNKGQVKVDRLELENLLTLNDISRKNIIAYSDSSADLPMLNIASRQVLVNPSALLISRLNSDGCEIVKPLRPWMTPYGKMKQVFLQLLGFWRK